MIRAFSITTESDFFHLRDKWNKLIESSNVVEITLTWEWLFTWWSVFKDERQLLLITVYDDEELIAIAPFLKRKVRYFGCVPFWRIELLGTGEDEKDEICSDYLDLIVKEGKESGAIEAIFTFLTNRPRDWDEIIFADTIETSPNINGLMERFRNASYMVDSSQKIPCPYISLPGKQEDLIKKVKTRFNRQKRLIEQEGTIEYSLVTQKDEFDDVFNRMVALHQRRWVSKGKSGCFVSSRFIDFHKRISALLCPLKRIKLFFLKVNGKDIATLYCFAFKNKVYGYLSGLEMSFKKTLSPGFVLLAYCLQDAISSGKTTFDFFKGRHGSYKYDWTDKERFVITYRISQSSSIKHKVREYVENGEAVAKLLLLGKKTYALQART